MRKILFVLAVAIALQISFVSCQQNGKDTTTSASSDTTVDNNRALNKGVYKEYEYVFYDSKRKGYGEYISICSVTKDVYKDGSIVYEPYMRFISSYENQYSTDCLILSDEDLSNLLEFMDSCSVYKISTSDVQTQLRCDVGYNDHSATFVYQGSLGVYFDVNIYNVDMSIKELRNIISGFKVKVERLKEEDAAKNNKK